LYNNGGNETVILNSQFINNTAYQHGGAMDNVAGNNVTIRNSSFLNNKAETTSGGAIYIHDNDKFEIDNCEFINNSAKTDGGAIFNYGNNTYIHNSNFTDNKGTMGGAIYNYQNTNTTVENSSFRDNIATKIKSGGAIYNEGHNLSINNSNFKNNSNIAIYTIVNSTNISNSNFKDNEGVLGIGFSDSKVDLANSLWKNNSISNNSNGIIIVDGKRNELSNLILEGHDDIWGISIYGTKNVLTNISISNFSLGLLLNIGSSYNTFKNGTIKNNVYGVIIEGDVNNITGTNIINNTDYGIFVDSGEYNFINYNRIYGNGLGLKGQGSWTDANFNWWGYNDITEQFNTYGNYTNLTNWYEIRLSAPDIVTFVNDSKVYPYNTNIYLNYDFVLSSDVPNDPSLLPDFDVSITYKYLNNGILEDSNQTNGLIPSLNHQSNSGLILDDKTVYSIEAKADGEDVLLTLSGMVQANISIEKTGNATDTKVGDIVNYTITVKNNEMVIAENVTVLDLLDDRLTFLSDDGEGSYDPSTGIWNIGTLNGGQIKVLTISVLVNGLGHIPNYANLSFNGNNTNNNSNVSYNITSHPYANVTIVKTVNQTDVNDGDVFSYNITVKNTGTTDANGIVVQDNLNDKLEYISHSCSNISYDNYSPSTGIWNIGTLSAGQELILTIVVRALSAGIIDNTATISSNETIIPPGNSTVTIRSHNVVYLTIEKIANSSTVNNGEIINYTIIVQNHGPDNATGVYVTDLLNEGLEFISASSPSYDRSTGIWNIGELGNGESIELNIEAKVVLSGIIENLANITSNEPNINPNTNTSITINSNPIVNITVEKSVNSTNVTNGDTILYTITVTNHGPDNATGVVVFDLLPEGLLFISKNSPGHENYNHYNGRWDIGNMFSNETITLEIVALVVASGEINNSASVTTNEPNINPKTNTSVNISSKPLVNVTVVKTSNVTDVESGDYVKFTLNVTNHGPDNATGVLVFDKLEPYFIFINASDEVSYDNESGIWTIGNLLAGESVILDIIVQVNGTGILINRANLTTTEDNVPPNTDVNVTIISHPLTDIIIEKFVSKTNVVDGEIVSYTIVISNYGPDDATGVEVIEKLVDELIYISDNSNGTYDPSTGIWNVGNLTVGVKRSLSVTVKVNGTGIIANFASFASNEPNINKLTNVSVNIDSIGDDLEIKITSPNYNYILGDKATFRVTVSNIGLNTDTNVIANVKIPNGLKYSSSNASIGTYNPNTGQWIIGSINPGEKAYLDLILDCEDVMSINFPVNVSGSLIEKTLVNNNDKIAITILNKVIPSPNPDNSNKIVIPPNKTPTINNNKTNGSIVKKNYADLEIIIKVNKNTYELGDKVTFKIHVKNLAIKDTDVLATVKLPKGLKFILSKIDKGSYDQKSGLWNIGNLNPNQTVYMTLTAKIESEGNIVFPTVVSGKLEESNLNNNFDEAVLSVSAKTVAKHKKTNPNLIAMKKTAIPLHTLIFMILSLFTLFIFRKKNFDF